jgi:hypothetical protein
MHEDGLAVSGLARTPSETIVAVPQSPPRPNGNAGAVEVKLLRRFLVALGDHSIGQWPRPPAPGDLPGR